MSSDFSDTLIRYASTEILTIVPRLILGIWLLVGARGLINWLHRIRNIGLEENDQSGTSQRSTDDANDI